MTKEHRWTIDAIEEFVARVQVDGRQMMHIPHWMLPRGARQGDVLAVRHEVTAEHSVLKIEMDESQSEKMRQHTTSEMKGAPKSGKNKV